MKPITLILSILFAIIASSFKPDNDSEKLYPKIESYFTSLDLTKKQEVNSDVLSRLKNNIELSDIDDRHTYIIAGNNSDAAAFTHIILYSWLKAKKFKKVDLISCASTQTISEQAISTLKEIGYKIDNNNGGYLVSFSDEIKPLKLGLLSCADKRSNQNTIMKIDLRPKEKNEKSPSVLYHSTGDSKELFNSIATDLFSVIQIIKK